MRRRAQRGFQRQANGLRKREESISEEAKEIAWKAQHRLQKRSIRPAAAGKDKRKIIIVVAREVLGVIWA
jgi:transposase